MAAARPSQAVIRNAIQAALACGLPVLGIEVTPEGGIGIIADPAAAPTAAARSWERNGTRTLQTIPARCANREN